MHEKVAEVEMKREVEVQQVAAFWLAKLAKAGEKAADVRLWLEAYSYWNQGGAQNVETMLRLIAQRVDDAAPTPE